MDLIAACVAVTTLFVMQRPTVMPVRQITQTDAATPVEAKAGLPEVKKKRHPLQAMANLGMASWYGAVLDGHRTASGEIFHKELMTACHRTLPFGTIVRVVDVTSGKSVVVRINDRGVLYPDRIIDLSSAAAQDLGILRAGVAKVRLEVLKRVERSSSSVRSAGTEAAPAAEKAAADKNDVPVAAAAL